MYSDDEDDTGASVHWGTWAITCDDPDYKAWDVHLSQLVPYCLNCGFPIEVQTSSTPSHKQLPSPYTFQLSLLLPFFQNLELCARSAFLAPDDLGHRLLFCEFNDVVMVILSDFKNSLSRVTLVCVFFSCTKHPHWSYGLKASVLVIQTKGSLLSSAQTKPLTEVSGVLIALIHTIRAQARRIRGITTTQHQTWIIATPNCGTRSSAGWAG